MTRFANRPLNISRHGFSSSVQRSKQLSALDARMSVYKGAARSSESTTQITAMMSFVISPKLLILPSSLLSYTAFRVEEKKITFQFLSRPARAEIYSFVGAAQIHLPSGGVGSVNMSTKHSRSHANQLCGSHVPKKTVLNFQTAA